MMPFLEAGFRLPPKGGRVQPRIFFSIYFPRQEAAETGLAERRFLTPDVYSAPSRALDGSGYLQGAHGLSDVVDADDVRTPAHR